MVGVLFLAEAVNARPVNCDAAVGREVVDSLLDEAQVAVQDLDSERLIEAIDKTHLLVRCVEEVLEPQDIARLYRLSGISAYVAEDLVTAASRFEVAKAIAPDVEMDASLGAPLRMTYDAVSPPTNLVVALPRPSLGRLAIDGLDRQEAPTDRGYFLQWVGKEEVVRGTWMVPEGGVPGYPISGAAEGTKSRLLRIGGLAAIGVGVASFTTGSLLETFTDDDGWDGLWDLEPGNAALVLTGTGLTLAGGTMFGVSFALGR